MEGGATCATTILGPPHKHTGFEVALSAKKLKRLASSTRRFFLWLDPFFFYNPGAFAVGYAVRVLPAPEVERTTQMRARNAAARLIVLAHHSLPIKAFFWRVTHPLPEQRIGFPCYPAHVLGGTGSEEILATTTKPPSKLGPNGR